ncbi:MAG: WYL domain-containing protein [Candidatus Margulisbacteria bacterium]|nr:WYL domain-containing protein [Candidatus Margulisiibacteriota bacterium]
MKNSNLDRHVLIRFIQIDRIIREGKYPNAVSLAKKFELSPRTMQRDIETLKNFLHADIQFDRTKNGYYYPAGSPEVLPGLKLSEEELFILFLTEKILPEIQPEFSRAFQKLIQKLHLYGQDSPAKQNYDVEKLLSFDAGKPMIKDGLKAYQLLTEAIQKKRSVDMKYYTTWSKQHSERLFDPYHLRYTFASWVVIGYCHLRKQMRVFAISNIEDIKLTKNKFVIPDDFSVENFIGNAWGIIKGDPVQIKLRFAEEISEWITQRQWNKTQEVSVNKDGSIILSMTVDGVSEVIQWILSWGSSVEVLEPAELREMVKEEVKRLGKMY